MDRFQVGMMVAGLILLPASMSCAVQSNQVADASSIADTSHDNSLSLPPAPKGKSTIMGGEISNVDPVRDQLSLKIFGEKPMKILFDERTQVYRDGTRIPLRDLHTEDHASVQTVLDGVDVFALSIHILSKAPQAECQGKVLSFNPGTGELTVSSAISRIPIDLIVPPSTRVARVGQPTFVDSSSGFSDLTTGALVSVQFDPSQRGRSVASQISILAIPGAQFVFAGDIAFLDLNAGQMELIDSRDDKTYQISFNMSRIPAGRKLHVGDHIGVTADYQTDRFIAKSISVY